MRTKKTVVKLSDTQRRAVRNTETNRAAVKVGR